MHIGTIKTVICDLGEIHPGRKELDIEFWGSA